MVNNYYQKHKERLQKEEVKDIKVVLKKKKIKDQRYLARKKKLPKFVLDFFPGCSLSFY